ncbi:MAG: hypothetical protein J0I12_11070 [Candidatus Eremiobacteraeota bacterium]|nr:hypothetical protein [Candidatus Eremiobacteraeota bacterium]
MAISLLGRVVGATQGILHMVNGEGETAKEHASSQAYHPVTPEQFVVKAEGQDAAARVQDVLAGLAGQGPLGAALVALKPELAEATLSEDDQDLLNWLFLYRHFKEALANDGVVDAGEFSSLLAELGQVSGASDLAKNWFSSLISKVTGKKPADKAKK